MTNKDYDVIESFHSSGEYYYDKIRNLLDMKWITHKQKVQLCFWIRKIYR